jgi:L-idonate 5-dehydrogenase
MKSVVCYGPKDLRLEELEQPVIGPDEVLISIEAGGICGSDLHYYNHGGFGTVRIQEPMILGHEVSGRVAELGTNVDNLKIGDLVAVNPSQPCRSCEYCKKAMFNQCLDMHYYGSAMRFPHVQGAFRQQLTAGAEQCLPFKQETSASEGAFAEPLAVALHAVKRAGSMMGKKILVTGSGPIGALVVAVAKMHGALEVVVTDVVDVPLRCSAEVGADRTINITTHARELEKYTAGKGSFDVVIEASGNEQALLSALELIRPQGRLVQLGLGGMVTIPQNLIVAKEIEICGTFRFHEEFAWAVALIDSGRLPLMPLLTDVFPVTDVSQAFETANNRATSMKVQLTFN